GDAPDVRPGERVWGERRDLVIRERGVFRVANRVAVARFPVPEATADGKTPVALACPVTLGASNRRVDHVVRERLRTDVVPVLLVEGDVLLAGQKPLDLRRQAHEFLQYSSGPPILRFARERLLRHRADSRPRAQELRTGVRS